MELFSGWSGPLSRNESKYDLGVRNVEALQFKAVPHFPDSEWIESVSLNTSDINLGEYILRDDRTGYFTE
jgi:hypothetical protein